MAVQSFSPLSTTYVEEPPMRKVGKEDMVAAAQDTAVPRVAAVVADGVAAAAALGRPVVVDPSV
jgi:hypothetical protein